MNRQFKKFARNLKRIAKMGVAKAGQLGLEFVRTQIKTRPRIRLFSKVMVILALAFELSNGAVSYLKPREAEIKINGRSLLVAQNTEGNQPEPEVAMGQTISARLSPFEFGKPVDGYLSQGYSWYHPGFDIATAFGTPIRPVGSGIVSFAGRVYDGKGNIVVVDHGDGLKSLYAHMDQIEVGVGNVVNANMAIGTVGITGRTTGSHVHLEIYDNGVAINPATVLPEF